MGYLNPDQQKQLRIKQEQKLSKSYYDRVNYFCQRKRLGYDKRNHRVKGLSCNNWSCARCRPKMKQELFYKVVTASMVFGLDKHIILTVPGRNYRNKVTVEESFELLRYDFMKLRKVLKYHLGDIEYIAMMRSQTDGYAHTHMLANKFIPQAFLKKKAGKYPNIGFTSIRQNTDVAKYLTNDFWKDHEYVIPDGKRHYSCSRNVAPYMAKNNEKSEDIKSFELNDNYNIFSQIEKVVYDESKYPVPLETMLCYLKPDIRPRIGG